MTVTVWLNRVDDCVATQTTAMLIAAAVRAGAEVWVSGVDAPDRGVHVTAGAAEAVVVQLTAADPVAFDAATAMQLWIRTNPARDPAGAAHHAAAFDRARALRDGGVTVINDPDGIAAAADKRALLELPPGIVPRTTVSTDRAALRTFFADLAGPGVLKPVRGTRGEDVYRIAGPDDPALEAALDAVLARGDAMAQAWADGAEDGDTRLVVLDGALLEVDGHPGAIRRRPSAGDFRSNLHAGGTAEPAVITPRHRAIIAAAGPWLVARGIRLAGLDVIGDDLIEMNVTSTGGLHGAEQFSGADFCGAIVAAFLGE
ncbi:MAG: ATP-grasp domain-containing protein [Planctomycetota bacterium]